VCEQRNEIWFPYKKGIYSISGTDSVMISILALFFEVAEHEGSYSD
jgi:hypothetical protein